jgi:cytochrome c-type biogenesis protein
MSYHKPPEQKGVQLKPDNPNLRRMGKFLFLGFLFFGTIFLLVIANYSYNIYQSITAISSLVQAPFQQWFEQQNTTNPFFLIPLAFAGGLVTSISPCILSLLPLNLSYIGTLNITSRRDAFVKASLFALGVTTVFSFFSLFASLASFVLVDFRGYFNIVVGTLILVMGLQFGGIINLPLPQKNISVPLTSPYGVGLTFALVSSPCGSPVLFTVLLAAAATGSQIIATLTMVSYALGYTAVIFFASLFTGLVKQSRVLLSKSDWVIRFGSGALILAGGYYLVSGIGWFL